MQLLLLGPVELRVAGRPIALGGPRQRGVMAALAVEAGTTVPVEMLIDRVWGDAPPPRVRQALQVYIARLRRLIKKEVEDLGSVAVVRRSGGYALALDPDCIDMCRFRRCVSEARDPGFPESQRVTLLGQALDLWRGPPLADLSGEWPARLREGWRQQHLEAVLAWSAPSLRLGRSDAVLARLADMVGEHPLTESLAAALMRALYAAGRPADALEHYVGVRRLLAQELGADPCLELQQLHRQILTADPALARPVSSSAPRVPRQLPPPPLMFIGRTHELGELTHGRDSHMVVISAIDGMAGIGKTALAVHAGHRLAERYPDGQLFVDLHGFTEGVAQVEPADALDRLLRDTGVVGERIPDGLDARAALWRSVLVGRRMLIVLDNAATEAQVRPLLPGGAGSLVLVTSRRRLTALDASHTISLDTLPQADAVRLFVHTADRPDLKADTPGSAAELAETVQLCGRLPLAIRIAAARLKHRRVWTVTDLVQRLRGLDARLAALDDGQRSVHATLSLSYQHLSAEAKRLYRLLGWHPGPEIELYAAAALTDSSSPGEVQRWLDRLADDHLLAEPAPGRYRFHDLVRAHAATTTASEETPSQQRAALDRLLEHYRHTAAAAMDLAYPYERQRRPTIAPSATPTPVLADREQAYRWLDTELANLLAAAQHAANYGWPEHTWHLSAILDRHLRTRGRYSDAQTLHQHALDLARHLGNRAAEIAALTGLGYVHQKLGDYEQAGDHYGWALQIAQAIGDRVGEVNALNGLGDVHRTLGRFEQAGDHFRRALQIAQTIGDRSGERNALLGLGYVHRTLGDYEQAGDYFGWALQIAQAIGDRVGEGNALHGLGSVHSRLGDYEQAGDHFGWALQIAQAIGDRNGEMNALHGLGHVHQMLGRYEQARDHYGRVLQIAQDVGVREFEMQALTAFGHAHRTLRRYSEAADCYQQVLVLARELHSSNWQYEALQGIGRMHHATGQPDLALTSHEQALQLATDLTQPADQARAHDGLAHAHHAMGQDEQARLHWQQALNILTSLGTDHTEDIEASVPNIRAHLAETMPPD